MGRTPTSRLSVAKFPFRGALFVIAACVLTSLVACSDIFCGDPIIATSNEGAILESEYQSWLTFMRHKDDGEIHRQKINDLVVTKKLAAEAETLGLEQRADIRKRINEAEIDILARAVKSHLARKIAIIEEDLKSYYNDNIKKFRTPVRVETQLIFLKAPGNSNSKDREMVHQRLESLRSQILEGEDFETLAKEYSESQTRTQGGHLGALDPEQFREPVHSTLKSLASGDISHVTDLGEGFALFRAEATLPAEEQRYRDVRSAIEEILLQRALKAEQNTLEERLSTQIIIDIPSSGLLLSSETNERVLAHYPGGAIRVEDVLLDVRKKGQIGTSVMSESRLRQISHRLALVKLKAAEARLQGLSETPQICARTEWSRMRILSQAMIEEKINERSQKASEDAIESFMRSNANRMMSKAYYGISVIFEFSDKAHFEKDSQRMQSVARKLQLGLLDFDELAKHNEALPDSINNLDLAAVSQNRLNAFGGAASAEIHSLKLNQISNLVRQSFRLWIFRLDTFHPASPLPPDEARRHAATILEQQQRRSLEANIRFDVINNANIMIHEKTDS